MPTDLTSAFTIEGLRELFEHVEESYSDDRALAEKMLSLYWGKHSVSVPDTEDKRRIRKVKPERMVTQEASRVVDLIHSLYATPAAAAAQWQGEGSKESRDADKIEVALNEAYDQLNPSYDSPRDRDRFQQILLGHGAHLGPMTGENYYWDFPFRGENESERDWAARYDKWRKGGPLPFVYVDLPAESTFPASYGLRNDLCVSSMETSYWELREMFSAQELEGVFDGRKQPGTGDTYTLALASNREYLAYGLMDVEGGGFANSGVFRGHSDRLIRSVKHGMGRSVIRIPPGLTRRKQRSNGVGHFWLPVLFHVADLIMAADRLLSIAATGAKFDALPLLKAWLEQDVSGEGAEGAMRHFIEGDVWQLRPDDQMGGKEDIQAIYQPQHGEHSKELLAFLLGRTERITGAVEAMEGIFSAETAWASNFAVEVATSKQAPLTRAIVAADMDDYEMIMRATEVHGHKIDLRRGEGGTISLKPEQMPQWKLNVKGEYKLHMPMNQIALWQTGVAMMQSANKEGIPLSPDWVMERVMGIEQPWDMFKKWIAWKAATDPRTYDRLYEYRMGEADEALTEEEKGITMEQMASEFGAMPPEQQAAANGGFSALRDWLTRGAQGAARAGSPFSVAPGGPHPTETTPGVVA